MKDHTEINQRRIVAYLDDQKQREQMVELARRQGESVSRMAGRFIVEGLQREVAKGGDETA